jgi:hypothetical protein
MNGEEQEEEHQNTVRIPSILFEEEYQRVSQQNKQKKEAGIDKRRQRKRIQYKKKLLLAMSNTPAQPARPGTEDVFATPQNQSTPAEHDHASLLKNAENWASVRAAKSARKEAGANQRISQRYEVMERYHDKLMKVWGDLTTSYEDNKAANEQKEAKLAEAEAKEDRTQEEIESTVPLHFQGLEAYAGRDSCTRLRSLAPSCCCCYCC